MTGINLYSGELTAKRLELLREVVPAAMQCRYARHCHPVGV